MYLAVSDSEVAAIIEEDSPCTRAGTYTAKLESHFGALNHPGTMAELQLGSLLKVTNIIPIERRHSLVRRDIVASSCQTHGENFLDVSTRFMARTGRSRRDLLRRKAGKALDKKAGRRVGKSVSSSHLQMCQ